MTVPNVEASPHCPSGTPSKHFIGFDPLAVNDTQRDRDAPIGPKYKVAYSKLVNREVPGVRQVPVNNVVVSARPHKTNNYKAF